MIDVNGDEDGVDHVSVFRQQAIEAATNAGSNDEGTSWRSIAELPDETIRIVILAGAYQPEWGAEQILAVADRLLMRQASKTRGKSRKTFALEEAILKELSDFDGPMSSRQLFYRCVSCGAVPNNKASCVRVARRIVKMRREGLIDYSRIVDRTRACHKRPGWAGAHVVIKQAAVQYRRDLWIDQKIVVQIACEKQALEGIFREECDAYGAALYVIRGFNSESFEYEWANDIKEHSQVGQRVIIAYFGDFDPSGLCTEENSKRKLAGFGAEFEWRRAGLLREDFDRFDLVRIPVKHSDTRSKVFLKQFGDVAGELDALHPAELQRRIAASISEHVDADRWEQTNAIAEAERETLNMVAKHWPIAVAAVQGAA